MRVCAWRGCRKGDVGVGSIASVCASADHFPSSQQPTSGIEAATSEKCLNGLMRRSKRHLYSITLSARPSSEGGTARPSALAVLRLTISSDFVGTCTHLGLPYESHRLQAPDRKGSTSEVQQ